MTLEMKMRDERKAGIREGFKEGQEISKIEIANKLLRQNHPIPFIMEITELSEEKIFELQRNLT